jgi:hypothetical protein
MVKVKIEVEDNEFPEWPPFPTHLVLMWNGIRQEMVERIIRCMFYLAPPILPLYLILKQIGSTESKR